MQVEITISLPSYRGNRLLLGRAKILPKMQYKNKINKILDERSEKKWLIDINQGDCKRMRLEGRVLLYFYCQKNKQIDGESICFVMLSNLNS